MPARPESLAGEAGDGRWLKNKRDYADWRQKDARRRAPLVLPDMFKMECETVKKHQRMVLGTRERLRSPYDQY